MVLSDGGSDSSVTVTVPKTRVLCSPQPGALEKKSDCPLLAVRVTGPATGITVLACPLISPPL